MHQRLIGIWLFVALGLAALSIRASALELQPGYLLDQWGTADGLPVRGISSVLVGRDGYVWLSTYGGLVRFDGHRFTTFASSIDNGLPNPRLMALMEGPDGRLWVVDESRNLLSFDGQRFRIWGVADGLPSNLIEFMPRLAGGALWVGSTQGAAVFDAATGRWRAIANTGVVNAISEEEDGTVWVGAVDGLFRVSPGAEPRPEKLGGLPSTAIRALKRERTGDVLWIATAAGVVRRLPDGRIEAIADYSDVLRIEIEDDGSVVMVSPLVDHVWRNGRIVDTPSDRGEPKFGPARLLHRDGAVWSSRRGTVRRNGVAVLDLHCAVNSMAMDRAGSVWLSSQCGGLQRIRKGGINGLTEVAGRPLGPVYGLAEEPDGSLWIGSIDGSVAVRRPDGTESHLGSAHGFGDNTMPSFLAEPNGTVWAGRTRLCVVRDDACHVPADLPPPLAPGDGRMDGSLSADIRGVYRDRAGALWVGSRTALWSQRDGRWTIELEGSHLRHARAFAETADGSLWVGTAGDGLYRKRPDGAWVRHGTAEGLSSSLIRSLHEDADGRLWVATENRGLCRSIDQSLAAWRFACIERAQGLWSDSLHQILVDRGGGFWISSNHGLMRAERADLDAAIERRSARVYLHGYTERDGLPDRELNGGVHNAGIVLADGRLAFPTQNGVAVVDPLHARTTEGLMRAVVEDVVHGDGHTLTPVNLARHPTLTLPRGERSIGLRFTGLSPELSPLAYFRYRLLPDSEWIDLGSIRQLNLSRLPAGQHTIEIMAMNSVGQPGETARVTLELPPWLHETRTFRYGIPTLLGGILLAWMWRQRQAAVRRQLHLEQTVSARTAELRGALDSVQQKNDEIARLADSKSRFFANISHELRTPLALISGPLHDAERGEAIQPAARRIMLANAQRLERLVTQLLDLERIDAGRFSLHPVPRDLAQMLRESVEAFNLIASRQDIALAYVGVGGPSMASVDPEQIERVIGNLLSNALKFTPAGGTVKVDLRSEGDRLRIVVADTGPGIPEEWRERIFDRFSQVESEATRSREGAGLGLVLCREIVALHQGRIWVEPCRGGGSRFMLELPLEGAAIAVTARDSSSPPLDAGAADSAGLSAQRTSRRRVLVVEDHPDLRAYIAGILARDHEVLQARDGLEGLEMALAELPDLIVSDVMMPRLDGLSLVRALRERDETAGIPLIFLTARAGDADEIEGLSSGADQYLCKPFDSEILRARVAAALHAVERLRRRFQSVDLALPAMAADPHPEPAPPLAPAPSDQASAIRDLAFTHRATAWLRQHMHDEALSLAEMAEGLHVSRATLNRRFAAAFGETPRATLRRLRLERAEELLAAGEGSVSEVAYAVGYSSLAVFSRAYRDRYGRTPTGRTRN